MRIKIKKTLLISNIFLNLEHLAKSIITNQHLLKNKKKTIIFFKYHLNLLAKKRKKLKLGAIIFEIKRYLMADIPLTETIEIKYIRQDTTEEDEKNIENRLNALKWKWNFSNVGALVIVSFFAIGIIYIYCYWWYCENFPAFAYREEKYDRLIENSLNMILNSENFKIKHLQFLNYWVIDAIVKFSIYFTLLF